MRIALALFTLACCVTIAQADDWPQWMGPERDNVWREDGLLKEFPEDGPKVVWRAPVAGGYAGPAVADGRVYVTDYVTEDDVKVANWGREESTGMERVLCLDEKTGEEVWKHEYEVQYTISYPAGPRCTPTVHDGKVYTLGAEGQLYCLDAATGEELWSKDFNRDYNTRTALWGYSGHPLIDGQKLICVVGGEGSLVVAFDKDTGKEIWSNLTSPEQGYAPPAILEIAGRRQLVLLRPDAVTALDPESGEEIWSEPYASDGGLVVMTPIVWQDYMFVGGYDNKCMLLKLAPDGSSVETLWAGNVDHGLSPVNSQPAMEDGIIYGFGHTNGRLYAVDLASGNRLWDTAAPLADPEWQRPIRSGTAFLVKQADRYWIFTENGDLIIAQLSPSGYEELSRAHLLKPTNNAFGRDVLWCPPAFANQRMYVRNDEECIAVDLAAE